MITLEQGVELVWRALSDAVGGEIYVKKIPSMRVIDIAKTINPNAHFDIIGIRPGEKIHEQMIGIEDAPFTYEYDSYYKILPQINFWDDETDRIKSGIKVKKHFTYTSDNNSEWMKEAELKAWIDVNLKVAK